MMLQGIDVSGNNGVIRWHDVPDEIRFVAQKLTEGTGWEDGSAKVNCPAVLGSGRLLGGYHYLRVRSEGKAQDARAQAQDFAAAWHRHGCEFAALDVEAQGNGLAKAQEVLDAVTEFVAEWRELVGTPIALYTYPGFWTALGPRGYSALELASLPLWIAHYAPPSARVPMVPAPWTDWTIWQYAAGAGVLGRVEGIAGDVDRNCFRGCYDDFKRLWGLPVALPTLAG